jgi:hypothetical protein
MIHLLATLMCPDAHPETARAILRRAKVKGLNPRILYNIAASGLTDLPDLPSWEDVTPE